MRRRGCFAFKHPFDVGKPVQTRRIWLAKDRWQFFEERIRKTQCWRGLLVGDDVVQHHAAQKSPPLAVRGAPEDTLAFAPEREHLAGPSEPLVESRCRLLHLLAKRDDLGLEVGPPTRMFVSIDRSVEQGIGEPRKPRLRDAGLPACLLRNRRSLFASACFPPVERVAPSKTCNSR